MVARFGIGPLIAGDLFGDGGTWTLRYQIMYEWHLPTRRDGKIFLDRELARMHGEGMYSLSDFLGKVEDDDRFSLGFETLLEVGKAD